MALSKFKAPTLPAPPAQWDAQYARQLLRALEIYFSQLDSATPNYAESYTADHFYGGFLHGDGTDVRVPYNQFYSMVDQTAPAIDVANALELEVTSFVDGISITGANDTRITFSVPGTYLVTYSLSFKNTTNDSQDIDIWFKYTDSGGGADIANSNSKFTIPARKASTDPSYLVATTSSMVVVNEANAYVEIMWWVSNLSVTLEHLPAVAYSAGVTPAIPATPSALVQARFVSATI
jgi:hypothetical protein